MLLLILPLLLTPPREGFFLITFNFQINRKFPKLTQLQLARTRNHKGCVWLKRPKEHCNHCVNLTAGSFLACTHTHMHERTHLFIYLYHQLSKLNHLTLLRLCSGSSWVEKAFKVISYCLKKTDQKGAYSNNPNKSQRTVLLRGLRTWICEGTKTYSEYQSKSEALQPKEQG